jgi:hypothetical protein
MFTPPKRRLVPGERLFAFILLGSALFLFAHAYSISGFSSLSSAGFFPMVATGLMVITQLITIACTLRVEGDIPAGSSALQEFRRRVTPLDILVFSAMMIGFALALAPLGFVPASFLFLTCSIVYLIRGRFLMAVGVSTLSTALIYVIFRVVFEVVLPKGWIFG